MARWNWKLTATLGGIIMGLVLSLAAFDAWGLGGTLGVIAALGSAWSAFRWRLRRTQRAIRERWELLSDAQRLAAMASLSEQERAEVVSALNESATRRQS